MDYTKFIRGGNTQLNKSKFVFTLSEKKIQNAMQCWSDIQRTQYFINNYTRLEFKIDLDEYFAYFLKEKNEFIKQFSELITEDSRKRNNEIDTYMNGDKLTLYKSIWKILRTNWDDWITNYKWLKQKWYRNWRKQERFYKMKHDFIRDVTKNQRLDCTNNNKSKRNIEKNATKGNEENISTNTILNEEETSRYKESNNVINIFMNNANKSYEKTKQILFELSDWMTTVQRKMFEQGEMTKNILFNSEVSINNIEQGNKEWIKAHEYQKGRGLFIGWMFMVLGLFLILYDMA